MFTLACATRVALDDEATPEDAPHQRAQFEIWRAAAQAGMQESPTVCDVCHATAEHIVERGHFGDCTATGRHQHVARLAVAECPEWIADRIARTGA